MNGCDLMEPKKYIVSAIEGEYAYLHDLEGKCDEDIFISLCLLPMGVDIGSRLEYNFLEYTLID